MGGKDTGANPTDRSKSGTKRSLLVEAHGIPLALTIAGANRHDVSLLEETLESFGMEVIAPTQEDPQHLCLEAAYDAEWVYDLLEELGYTPHIRSRFEEKSHKAHLPGYRARRWVVERSHSWFNRFRRLLIRWEKKAQNYLAFLHLACSFIAYRSCGFFG